MNTEPTFKASKYVALMPPDQDDDGSCIGACIMLATGPGRRGDSSASLRDLGEKPEANKRQIIVKEGGAWIWPFSDISNVKTKSSLTLDTQILSCALSAGPLVFTRRATAQPFGRIL